MAKSRSKLPHLYYPRSNSVRIINSHWPGGGSSAPGPVGIGGELGWWCPSIDDAAVGTDVLTNFGSAGSVANGSLDSFANIANAWEDNTQSGGVRGIRLSHSTRNVIRCGLIQGIPSNSDYTITLWVRSSDNISTNQFRHLAGWSPTISANVNTVSVASRNDGGTRRQANIYGGRSVSAGGTLSTSVWTFIAGRASGTNPFTHWIRINDVAAEEVWFSTFSLHVATPFTIGNHHSNPANGCQGGLYDDVRLFSRVLTDAELDVLASQRAYMS